MELEQCGRIHVRNTSGGISGMLSAESQDTSEGADKSGSSLSHSSPVG